MYNVSLPRRIFFMNLRKFFTILSLGSFLSFSYFLYIFLFPFFLSCLFVLCISSYLLSMSFTSSHVYIPSLPLYSFTRPLFVSFASFLSHPLTHFYSSHSPLPPPLFSYIRQTKGKPNNPIEESI